MKHVTLLVAVAIGLVLITPASATASLPATSAAGLRFTPVTFTGQGGVRLHGMVVAPTSAGPHPGMVLVGGAGPDRWTNHLQEAEAFAHGGIVSLAYDKRTVGYSAFERSYSVLATDALAAVHLLRSWPGADVTRVGLWGFSEGGWVASLAASRSSQVAFLVTVGASGPAPARQQAWTDAVDLRHRGVSGSLLTTFPVTAARLAVGAGIFPEASYDTARAWEHVRQPVLALWGDDDRESPPAVSASTIRRALASGGNTRYVVRFFAGARHDLHVTHDQGFDAGTYSGGFSARTPLAPGYAELVTRWVSGLRHQMPVASVQEPPRPDGVIPAIPPLAWYESPWVQLAVVLLLLLGFASAIWVRRPMGRPARMFAASGFTAVIGLFGYLFFLLFTAGESPGPVVAGRPLPWLALQLAAVGTVGATAATALSGWRYRRHGRMNHAHFGVLIGAGLLFVPWALYWGLLRP